MKSLMRPGPMQPQDKDSFVNLMNRSGTMQWETPQAVEMRFGMEITMYVSNR